jgi:dTDP-glucose 4,6-dehydratase
MRNCLLVTGVAGFIGSNFVIQYLNNNPSDFILGIDAITYAGNISNLDSVIDNENFVFIKKNIGENDIESLLKEYNITGVINFAAETHVDNSILDPIKFFQTNVMETSNLALNSLKYYRSLSGEMKDKFRFLHVSTDEVFGALSFEDEEIFHEEMKYAPNSPYSASKASSDFIMRSFFKTYNFPVVVTNCSNNYGNMQLPEKLIPKTIISCIKKQPITVYGNGKNIRDWIHVLDHCSGVELAFKNGKCGESYCFGGDCEIHNIDIVKSICDIFNSIDKSLDHHSLISYVEDRLGHDLRYSVSSEKSKRDLGFDIRYNINTALTDVIDWYRKSYS